MSDVWDIPYLNPKAKERVGYPTQKPILLLERVIELVTDTGDWVLDPFCGSGTTMAASKILERNAIGIDISEDAIGITNERLLNTVKTESALMKKGRSSYVRDDIDSLGALDGIDHFVVHRNQGIDAILKREVSGKPVFVRIQRNGESIYEASSALWQATQTKGDAELLVIVTNENDLTLDLNVPSDIPPNIRTARSTSAAIESALQAG